MNCLWLTRQDPRPADSGEFLYSLGLIRSLAAAGVDVSVLCHASEKGAVPLDRTERQGETGEIHWKFVPRELRSRALSLLSSLPSDSFRLSSPAMRDRLCTLLRTESWDVVVVDHAAMAWTLRDVARSASRLRPLPTIVYVSHNHEGQTRSGVARQFRGFFPLRFLLHFDANKYRNLERRLCLHADLISAITPSDAKLYRASHSGKLVVCLTPGYAGESIPPRAINADTPRTVLFLGSFQWVAKRMNLRRFVRAAESVFPRENIRLQIVGKADNAFVRSIVQDRDWCRFAPNVPYLESFLKTARLGVVAEESGGGFKLKTLDYIFHRLPIAALSDNVRDLSLSPGAEFLDADSPEDLVRVIAENIDDVDRLNSIQERAHENHADQFNWPDRGEQLLQAMENARYPSDALANEPLAHA